VAPGQGSAEASQGDHRRRVPERCLDSLKGVQRANATSLRLFPDRLPHILTVSVLMVDPWRGVCLFSQPKGALSDGIEGCVTSSRETPAR
jgi:hypothetical protein